MPTTATVNYHVQKAEQQAFVLDADGVEGNLISPELVTKTVDLTDIRDSNLHLSFARDAVEFARFPSDVCDFDAETWQESYERELTQFLSNKLSTQEVLIFDHTIRVDDPDAPRKPARNVHSDYSELGARRRLVDLLGKHTASKWSDGHFAFVNVWRPIGDPINSAPLGFVYPPSVESKDWILLDLIYPDRKGQILGLACNPNHSWLYHSKMTPNDVAFFNIFDNRGLPSVAHSALDMVEDPNVAYVRKSIESRTLVRY